MQIRKMTAGAIFLSMTLTAACQIPIMETWGVEQFYRVMEAAQSQPLQKPKGSDANALATMSNALRFARNMPWDGYSVSQDFEGDGSEQNPYLIQSPQDLKLLADRVSGGETMKETYFLLTNDIDLNGKAWISIGYDTKKNDGTSVFAFEGVLDGGEHWIKGLYQRYSNAKSYVGLFARCEGGAIRNLKVEGVVSGYDRVGGIVGEIKDGVLENCRSSVYVVSSNLAGGIVAAALGDSLVSDCVNDRYVRSGNSTGDSFAGGIVGLVDEALISDCQNLGDVTARDAAGGIVGVMRRGEIYNCQIPYLSASAPAIGGQNEYNQNLYPNDTGGIVGVVYGGAVKNCRFAGVLRYRVSEGKSVGLYIGRVEAGNLGDQFQFLYCQKGKEGMLPFGQGPNDRIEQQHHIGFFDGNRVSLISWKEGSVKELDHLLFQVLEQGVLAIGEDRLHHFAPDRKGDPVRGYYLHVPGIANGTLKARQVNDFAYTIDNQNPGAVAAGAQVLIVTEPVNQNEVTYTLVPDSLRLISLEQPVKERVLQSMEFYMPNRHMVLSAAYEARVSGLRFGQKELEFQIVEKRTGPVEKPYITYEVSQSQSLLPKVLPTVAANQQMLWSMDQENICEIDQQGNVSVKADQVWIKLFLQQHGLLPGQKGKHKSNAREAALNPVTVETHRQIQICGQTVDGGFEDQAQVLVHYKLVDSCYAAKSFSSGSSSGSSPGSGSLGSGTIGSQTEGTFGPGDQGAWQRDETGWWYRFLDGTYARQQWLYLTYEGEKNWYYFKEDGYMAEGWLSLAGNQYYLHPVADGKKGHMYTGWHNIDGIDCYFDQQEGAGQGRLMQIGPLYDRKE